MKRLDCRPILVVFQYRLLFSAGPKSPEETDRERLRSVFVQIHQLGPRDSFVSMESFRILG